MAPNLGTCMKPVLVHKACSLCWYTALLQFLGTKRATAVPWHQNLCTVPCLFTSCTLSWYFKLAANLCTQCLVTVDSLCWYPALLLYVAFLGTQPCYTCVHSSPSCSVCLFLHCKLVLVPYLVNSFTENRAILRHRCCTKATLFI